MTQKTAKTIEDVLDWVENNEHHIASLIDDPGYLVLRGHNNKLRIPEELRAASANLIEPSARFDARMYRATKTGRDRLRRYKKRAALQLQGGSEQ